MPKQKFKNGMARVPGHSGKWDINYQVNGKRETDRIEASSYDEALAVRVARKEALRSKLKGNNSGILSFELNGVLEKLKAKVRTDIEMNRRCKTAISEVENPFRRFFFDYPKYLGKKWVTTADFTPQDFEEYQNYYGIVLGRPSGVTTEMSKIGHIFTHLNKLGFITSYRLLELRLVKRPKKNIRPYIGNPDEDFDKVLEYLRQNYPRLYDFILFVGNTGRRPKEVKAYKREYLNLNDKYIYVPGEVTKNGESNNIYFGDDLKKVVERVMNFSRKLNSEYLFLNDQGKRFSANNPQTIFKKAAQACEIPNWKKWGIYQLKKRFITVCRSNQLSTEAISLVTGHKDLQSVVKSYSFPDKAQADKVLKTGGLKIK